MMGPMKKYVVEFIGTLFLVLTIGCCVLAPAGSGIIAPLAIASVLSALKITQSSLADQRIVVFGAGTAAVVSPIVAFSYKGTTYDLPKQEESMAMNLKENLNKIQYKLSEDTFGWTVKV